MSGALAIFVKTPGWSALKTRLAAVTGEAYAQHWYRLAADAVASVALRTRDEYGLTAYWAVAEAGAEDEWTGLPTISQGDGDLGTRMARVHSELVRRHGFAMLIGADAPQLTTHAVGDAIRWLAGSANHAPPMSASEYPSRMVLGPAADGGFWLFGSSRVIPLQAWTQVPYSQADTCDRFQESMLHYGQWRTLAALTDVDVSADLKPVQRALDALADPTAAQRTLAQWMRESTPLAALVGRR